MQGIAAFVPAALCGLWRGFWMGLLAVLLFAIAVYVNLRRAEARDFIDQRAPDRATNAAMFERENRAGQNHMISITQRKPGALRWFTSRLVFWAVGEFAARYYRPGFLSDIGTIHFARWVLVDNKRRVLFTSNYDGGHQAYMDDFINKAAWGLNVAFSSGVGWPRTDWLLLRGARREQYFKYFQRRHQLPTQVWYKAYPGLTLQDLRRNALIRAGLEKSEMSDAQALAWLKLL